MHKASKLVPFLFVLIIIGFIGFFLNKNSFSEYKFNFNKAELTISQTNISEQLTYIPDQDYHTLFRNFVNPLLKEKENISNSIILTSLTCSAGIPYINDYSGNVFIYQNKNFTHSYLEYTESNEYGCGFGEEYGFTESNKYIIHANYTLIPENLFKINENYYIKFVLYSAKNHHNLYLNKNFFINSENIISKKEYFEDEDVIIYIPYTDEIPSNTRIINQNSFEFDSNTLVNLLTNILFFLSPILLLAFYLFFGKEKIDKNIPEALSVYPQERKPWEIASFFNFPRFYNQRNLISSTLLDFYHRKLIDIKTDKKETFFKINNSVEKEKFDNFEKDFISLLKSIMKYSKPSKLYEGYYSIKKLPNSIMGRMVINSNYQDMTKTIAEKGKEFKTDQKFGVFALTIFLSLLVFWGLNNSILIFSMFVQLFFVLVFSSFSPELFFRFKKDYFSEYQKWQAFRKYLNTSYTIKSYGHGGVVIWQKYLVYASALGVASKVLKELQTQNIITSEQVHTYQGISTFSNTIGFISMSSSAGSGTGGFGGAAGGGIGGGGGGGR